MRTQRVLNYYGSKVQAAHHYPPPKFDTIVEPFAGGAGYSLLWRSHKVILRDLSEPVIAAWQFLISTPSEELLRLPLLKPGESIPLDLPAGARALIGFSTMLCGSHPQRKLVASSVRAPTSYWGLARREGLARLADMIRHWNVQVGGYQELENIEATWFIDPPYQGAAGKHYDFNSSSIDYSHLAGYARERRGQVIVCEGPGANWLPFQPSHTHASAPTADVIGRRRSSEFVWLGGAQ